MEKQLKAQPSEGRFTVVSFALTTYHWIVTPYVSENAGGKCQNSSKLKIYVTHQSLINRPLTVLQTSNHYILFTLALEALCLTFSDYKLDIKVAFFY